MRFGILGTADIAQNAVIPAIRETSHEVASISSRDADRAASVADEFGIRDSYGSYEELLSDADVDAIYNPLPNALHAEWTKRAADEQLDVLCEKPLAVDADEARDVKAYCDEKGVTLMEGFMYRYHPRTERAVSIVDEELGDPQLVKASFQFPLTGRPDDVRLNSDLAGGSLMDVGCYPVNVARLFLGEPAHVQASLVDSRDSGVDTQLTGILTVDGGAMATISSSFDTEMTQTYRVEATNGWLEVSNAFDTPRGATTTLEYAVDGRRVTEEFDPADPYRREIEHFAECVEAGISPRTGGDEAVRNMRVIDALYDSAQAGAPVDVT